MFPFTMTHIAGTIAGPVTNNLSSSDAFAVGDSAVGTRIPYSAPAITVYMPATNALYQSTPYQEAIYSGIRFNADGTVDEIGPLILGTTAYLPNSVWCSVHTTAIGSDYEIRCNSVISGAWDLQALTVGTWGNMGTARTWREGLTAMQSNANELASGWFEIREAGGSIVSSFAVTCEVQNGTGSPP